METTEAIDISNFDKLAMFFGKKNRKKIHDFKLISRVFSPPSLIAPPSAEFI
jgi:hypothetical protein